MSFFGFDTSMPRGQPHNQSAHGFGQAPDAFAGLSARNNEDDCEVSIDFEDTYEGYDGLGDQLEETNDDFNADTFGAAPIGKDFDFSGQTATLSGGRPQQPQQPMQPSPQPQFQSSYQPQYSAQQPTTKPARSGYERYKEPGYLPKLEADTSIWGPQSQRPSSSAQQSQGQQRSQEQPMSIGNISKKMMSLEEVEALMRSGPKQSTPQPPQQAIRSPPTQPTMMQRGGQGTPQFPQAQNPFDISSQYSAPNPAQGGGMQPPPVVQRRQPMYPPSHDELLLDGQKQSPAPPAQRPPPQPQAIPAPRNPQIATMHNRGPSYNGQPVTNPEQLLQMTDAERAAYLEVDAKRAKRNHKIQMLSRDNGLMTPQDKNFITRIQLQQLLTATGNVENQGPEAPLSEDFYYAVFCQVRGARGDQPLSQFAQTYLHQTTGRMGNRRGYARGGDNIRRMEQQVQRAVEAAKMKPKNKHMVIEGSLGKISFSNAKTPKPLLNLRRPDGTDAAAKPRAQETVAGRKATLGNIENLYTALIRMEDHERRMPESTTEDSSADQIQAQIDWRARIQELNAALWNGLKVMEPIDPTRSTPHPFISILSHPKGKKIMPRIFRQIDDQQRLTILTMIAIHLDTLDVVRDAQPVPDDEPLPYAVRNEIELFSMTVIPGLFTYINEASLGIVVGLLGLIVERVNLTYVARSRIGLIVLTVFLSRAELLRHAGHAEPEDQQTFSNLYNQLFDALEPVLPSIFTTLVNGNDDMYVWQFLAALGTGASPDQQPRLVVGVKDRVMDTVTTAKQLPEDMGRPRLDNVNLFMRAIGLDVELLG